MRMRRLSGGFTLVEMMVATAIGGAVIAGMLTLFISFLRSYNSTTLMRNTSSRASTALERMVYGVGGNAGLREAGTATISITNPTNDWRIAYTNLWFQYTRSTGRITDQSGKIICTDVTDSTVSNTTTGCRIVITVAESAGGRTSINSMGTFVQFRN